MVKATEERTIQIARPQKEGALAVYNRISDPVAAVEKLGQYFHQSGMLGVKRQGRSSARSVVHV